MEKVRRWFGSAADLSKLVRALTALEFRFPFAFRVGQQPPGLTLKGCSYGMLMLTHHRLSGLVGTSSEAASKYRMLRIDDGSTSNET